VWNWTLLAIHGRRTVIPMFAVHCPRHGRQVLLGPRSIQSLENTAEGVVLHWECRCGAVGTVRTGRPHRVHDTVDERRCA
jgi:hypothetical protein